MNSKQWILWGALQSAAILHDNATPLHAWCNEIDGIVGINVSTLSRISTPNGNATSKKKSHWKMISKCSRLVSHKSHKTWLHTALCLGSQFQSRCIMPAFLSFVYLWCFHVFPFGSAHHAYSFVHYLILGRFCFAFLWPSWTPCWRASAESWVLCVWWGRVLFSRAALQVPTLNTPVFFCLRAIIELAFNIFSNSTWLFIWFFDATYARILWWVLVFLKCKNTYIHTFFLMVYMICDSFFACAFWWTSKSMKPWDSGTGGHWAQWAV